MARCPVHAEATDFIDTLAAAGFRQAVGGLCGLLADDGPQHAKLPAQVRPGPILEIQWVFQH